MFTVFNFSLDEKFSQVLNDCNDWFRYFFTTWNILRHTVSKCWEIMLRVVCRVQNPVLYSSDDDGSDAGDVTNNADPSSSNNSNVSRRRGVRCAIVYLWHYHAAYCVHSCTVWVRKCCFRPQRYSKVYFLKTEKFLAVFYAHILRSNLCKTTKFHSIIPNFDNEEQVALANLV